MRRLNPTPPDALVDRAGRPYFLWDNDLTLEAFRGHLCSPDPKILGYYVGKLLRQAKPDDAFLFVTLQDIERDWDEIAPFLGDASDFWAWLLSANVEQTVTDLVGDPIPVIDPPIETEVGGVVILVDTPREILVNKLCALLSRSELRDIEDAVALQDIGVDLAAAIESSPRKDAGFSPLTLAWTLRGLDVQTLGRLEGWPQQRIDDLDAARRRLIDAVLAAVTDSDPPI